jgi:hypothetical protein
MALGMFSAKFIINSSSPSGDNFIVNATIADGNGIYDASAVTVTDLVFIDVSSFYYGLDNAFVARYQVMNIVSQPDQQTINVELAFLDGGTVPNPADFASTPGFICRSSPNMKLAWVAAASAQQLSDYLVTYAFNISNMKQVEPVKDHANLSNLDYTNSGHTGFQASLIYDTDYKSYIVP